MNVLVFVIPVLAAGVFVAIWASRSGSSGRRERRGDRAAYLGGSEGLWDSGIGAVIVTGNEDSPDGDDGAADSGGGDASWDSGSDGGGGDGGGGDGGGGGNGGGD